MNESWRGAARSTHCAAAGACGPAVAPGDAAEPTAGAALALAVGAALTAGAALAVGVGAVVIAVDAAGEVDAVDAEDLLSQEGSTIKAIKPRIVRGEAPSEDCTWTFYAEHAAIRMQRAQLLRATRMNRWGWTAPEVRWILSMAPAWPSSTLEG